MRFRKIDNPPTHQEAIMLPPPGEPYPVVVPLDMGFIRTERAYWSKTFDRADKNGIPLLRSTAQTMRNTLGTVVERGEEIRASVERGGNLGFSTVELIEWHMVGTKAVAWSRMWQEMTSEEFTPQASASGKRVEILTDLPFNSVIYCGVHANDETFVELFNTPPPEPSSAASWLVGTSVYLEALKPAQASVEAEALFDKLYNMRFPAEDFTTVRPHLMPSVWLA